MEAIEKRFGGNTETKKVQKTILKQQFENFTGSSSEDLDQIHDRLQKLVSQLKIHGVSLSQEDVNLKFLRSLPYEWMTHTLIWRNKADLEEQNLDDLFNSLKIYETKVKQSSSSGTATQNLAFVSSTSTDSTIDSVGAAASVSAACVKLPASPLPYVDSLSNAVIYSLSASQSTIPKFNNEDLKQIDVDDLKEMDLRWECRSPKDPRRTDTIEPQRRTVLVETSTSNALISQCYGTGSYDWSYQAEEEPANFTLMDFSSNSSSDNETGLESVEARLLVYKQNESVFEENIKLLNIKVKLRDTALVTLRQKLENAKQERDDLKLKLEKFQTSSKNLTDLLASQTNEKTGLRYNSQVFTKAMFDCDNYYSSKSDCESWPPSNLYDRFQPSGGYHDVPPPYTGTFMPPKPDLPEQDLTHTFKPSALIIEDWISDFEEESELKAPQQFVPSFAQSTEHVKTPRHSVQPIETIFQAATSVPASPKGHHKQYAPLTHLKPQEHRVPSAALTQSKPVVTKSKSPIRWHITHNPSSRTSNSPPRVNVVQVSLVSAAQGNPQQALKDKGVIDSGFSRHMTGNMSYLYDFKELNRGYVAFGELKFNLFSVSQICDKKNSVLFTDTECLILSSDFKLPDESQVLLRVPRENNMYNVNLKNIVPSGDLTCLFAKSILDESNLWHRRLAHVNLKTINKLVKRNLVRGFPTEVFENDHTYVACRKGKQHRASLDSLRSDNGTEFKNSDLNQFCGLKGIKREFSVPRTPQQNGIAKRKKWTLIETARTMLVDSLLPILFWAEAVNTACYVQNRVLVTKPRNKTPYEVLHGQTPSIGFMRPFGCPVTILNTLDPLGKFQGKVDEGFL
nr:hypothetical protein [Tanacetum cinerariifolium]